MGRKRQAEGPRPFVPGRMLGSPGSDIGVDLPGRERQKIALTAIARVRRNLPGLASEVGLDGIDQGNKLRTVAHALRQSMRHDDLLGPSTAACAL